MHNTHTHSLVALEQTNERSGNDAHFVHWSNVMVQLCHCHDNLGGDRKEREWANEGSEGGRGRETETERTNEKQRDKVGGLMAFFKHLLYEGASQSKAYVLGSA